MQHAQAALEDNGAACEHCEALPLRVLRSRLALFDEEGQPREPRGAGPASAEAARRRSSWGSQMDLSGNPEAAEAPSRDSSGSSDVLEPRAEARPAASSARVEDPMLELSASEEVDVLSIEGGDFGDDSPPRVPAYEELVEVVSRAVAHLKIDWPQDKQEVQVKSKLDERFLQHREQPHHRGLPFFPDLHTEVCKSWGKPHSSRVSNPTVLKYSSIVGARENGYGMMLRVEQPLASYLSPESASSLKAPVLPTKPCRDTSSLVGRAYMAAGRAGASLHTMAILQAYQADLLKDIDQGEGPTPEDVAELRKVADLSLRVTKETARAVGRSMAAMVVSERHLWLNLSGIREKDRAFLLDAPISPSGLFGDAVNTVVDRFQEARKQSAAFKQFLPRRSVSGKSAPSGQPQPQPSTSSSSYRQAQKESVASRAPPRGAWGHRRRSQSKPQAKQGDLRAVLQAKKSSKRS
jgi:hypothetical protein